MSRVIKSILREELRNSKDLKKKYASMLQVYQPGSLIRRSINGQYYYYLSYRDRRDQKVKQKYLGKLSRSSVRKISDNIQERKAIMKNLKLVSNNIKYLEKVLR